MKKIVLLAVLALVLVAVPAFAAVQNVKVSGDIDSTYVYRNQFDLGHNTTNTAGTSVAGTQRQNFFMTQTRVRVDADLTDKVMATVQLLNERPWGNEAVSGSTNNSNAEVDVNLAYVTIKEMLYSPLTVIVGRQAFAFGNSFVIDSAGQNNADAAGGLKNVANDLTKRTAMDAIRAILDYNPLTIDLVYAKINANNLLETGATKDDIDLLGTNVNYKLGDKMNTVLEGYFWAKVDNSVNSTTVNKADTVYMPGAHAQINPLDGLMLSGELAWQMGNSDFAAADRKRDAFAYQGIASYKLPFEQTKKYSPVATASYTHVSGDKDPSSANANKAWDPMFENQSGGKIYNTLFNLTDSNILGVKGSIKPIEDVTAAVEWSGLWLDKKLPTGTPSLNVFQPDGSVVAEAVSSNTKRTLLGNEIDLSLAYAYTEDVTIGASLGVFRPGNAFNATNKKDATQALVNCDVKF